MQKQQPSHCSIFQKKVNRQLLPPAAKTLFIKRVLDSQKFFIKVFFIGLFLRVPSRVFAAKKNRRWILGVGPIRPFFNCRGSRGAVFSKRAPGLLFDAAVEAFFHFFGHGFAAVPADIIGALGTCFDACPDFL